VRFRSCRGLGRRSVDREPLQVVAGVEVCGESVAQVLGGEVVQRCCGHEASSDRGDIVSLIIDALHELRQRRPVSLVNESLVELYGQRRPPLLRSDLSRSNQPCFTSLTPCSGLAAARRGSVFHSFTLASRVCRTAGRGMLRRELMVLLP